METNGQVEHRQQVVQKQYERLFLSIEELETLLLYLEFNQKDKKNREGANNLLQDIKQKLGSCVDTFQNSRLNTPNNYAGELQAVRNKYSHQELQQYEEYRKRKSESDAEGLAEDRRLEGIDESAFNQRVRGLSETVSQLYEELGVRQTEETKEVTIKGLFDVLDEVRQRY